MPLANTWPQLLTRCIVAVAGITFLIVISKSITAERGWRQGDMWLKWNKQARAAYVLGYFEARSQLEAPRCSLVQSRWKRGVNIDEVAASLTDFYTQYAKDRDIYIGEVIEQLGRGLTAAQIHQYPFPAHHEDKKR